MIKLSPPMNLKKDHKKIQNESEKLKKHTFSTTSEISGRKDIARGNARYQPKHAFLIANKGFGTSEKPNLSTVMKNSPQQIWNKGSRVEKLSPPLIRDHTARSMLIPTNCSKIKIFG